MSRPTVRRRKGKKTVVSSFEFTGTYGEALEEVSSQMGHGDYAIVHRHDCPAAGNGVCECNVVILGPALRSCWQ